MASPSTLLPSAPSSATVRPPPPPPSFNYPPASSPEIIRSNQKDIHQTLTLQSHLTTLLRHLYGSRFTQTHSSGISTFTELLYLSLTTLIGNRTLGEEYCDIHQVESHSSKLPTIQRRGGYILSAVLLPYMLSKALPGLRTRLRDRLERSLESGQQKGTTTTTTTTTTTRHNILTYLHANITPLTSPSALYAVNLATFYLSGTYYQLSKRLLRLGYIVSGRGDRASAAPEPGYEVLGALLALQLAIQSYLHIRSATSQQQQQQQESKTKRTDIRRSRTGQATHTASPPPPPPPPLGGEAARYDLADEGTLAWLRAEQQRKCTLCLDALKEPAVTTCGHVFCWGCIQGWIRERAECPLCRQGCMGQHVLALRG